MRRTAFLFVLFHAFLAKGGAFSQEFHYKGPYRNTVCNFLESAKLNGIEFKFPAPNTSEGLQYPQMPQDQVRSQRDITMSDALTKAYLAELYSRRGLTNYAQESAKLMVNFIVKARRMDPENTCQYFCSWDRMTNDLPPRIQKEQPRIDLAIEPRECMYTGKNSKRICDILRYAKNNGVKFKFLSCPTCLDALYPSVPASKIRSRYSKAITRALEKAFETEQLARLNRHDRAEKMSDAVMKELAEANAVRGQRKYRYLYFWKRPGKKGAVADSTSAKVDANTTKATEEESRRYVYKGPHNDIAIDLLEAARLNGVKFKFPSCPMCKDEEYPELPPRSVVNERDQHIANALAKAYVVETYARREMAGQAVETAKLMMVDIERAKAIGFDIDGNYLSSWRRPDDILAEQVIEKKEKREDQKKTQATTEKTEPTVKSKLVGVVYAETMLLDQPSSEGAELSKFSRETEGLVLGRSEDGKWLLIKTIDEVVGWIPLNGLKEFKKLSHELATLARGAGKISQVVSLEETVGRLVKQAIIRKRPSGKSGKLWSGKVADKYKVIGKSKDGEWAKILLKDGTEGWIARNLIEELKTRVTSEVVGWIIGNLPLGSANIEVGKDGIGVRLVDGDRVHQVKIGASGASYATVKQTEEGVKSDSVEVGAHGVRYTTSTENEQGSSEHSVGVNTSGLNYSQKTIKENDNTREVARSDLDVGKGGLSFTHKEETLKRRYEPLDSVNLFNMLLSAGGVIFEGGGTLSLGIDLGWRYLDPSGNFPGNKGGSRNAFDFRLAIGGTYNPPMGEGSDQSGSIRGTATIGYTYLSFKENKTKTLENSGWGFNLGLMGGAGYNLGDYSAFLPIIGPNIGFEWFKYNPGEASYSSSQLVFLLIPVPGAMIFSVSYGGNT